MRAMAGSAEVASNMTFMKKAFFLIAGIAITAGVVRGVLLWRGISREESAILQIVSSLSIAAALYVFGTLSNRGELAKKLERWTIFFLNLASVFFVLCAAPIAYLGFAD
jgi:hypothetical protein